MDYLTHCKLCNAAVASNAKMCPHCGCVDFHPNLPQSIIKFRITEPHEQQRYSYIRVDISVTLDHDVIQITDQSRRFKTNTFGTTLGNMHNMHTYCEQKIELLGNHVLGNVQVIITPGKVSYTGDGVFEYNDSTPSSFTMPIDVYIMTGFTVIVHINRNITTHSYKRGLILRKKHTFDTVSYSFDRIEIVAE